MAWKTRLSHKASTTGQFKPCPLANNSGGAVLSSGEPWRESCIIVIFLRIAAFRSKLGSHCWSVAQQQRRQWPQHGSGCSSSSGGSEVGTAAEVTALAQFRLQQLPQHHCLVGGCDRMAAKPPEANISAFRVHRILCTVLRSGWVCFVVGGCVEVAGDFCYYVDTVSYYRIAPWAVACCGSWMAEL